MYCHAPFWGCWKLMLYNHLHFTLIFRCDWFQSFNWMSVAHFNSSTWVKFYTTFPSSPTFVRCFCYFSWSMRIGFRSKMGLIPLCSGESTGSESSILLKKEAFALGIRGQSSVFPYLMMVLLQTESTVLDTCCLGQNWLEFSYSTISWPQMAKDY